jgi:hypothetical protein
MGKMRDYFEPWLRDTLRRRYPELEPPLVRAIDAFDAIEEKQCITPELLAPIVEAASSSRGALWENATDFLGRLTGQYAEAREAVLAMVQQPHSDVRFNAICCLKKSTPPAMTLQLLRQGLRDKSAKVRWKAADQAGRLRVREIVPELENADAVEKNAKAKEVIGFELKLLRDGYILKRWPDGTLHVTTFTSNGISGHNVSESELQQRGIDAIVAEIASQTL